MDQNADSGRPHGFIPAAGSERGSQPGVCTNCPASTEESHRGGGEAALQECDLRGRALELEWAPLRLGVGALGQAQEGLCVCARALAAQSAGVVLGTRALEARLTAGIRFESRSQ